MSQNDLSRVYQINKMIPKELTRGLVKTERDTSQAEMAREVLKSGKVSKEGEAALRRALDMGTLVHETKVVDQAKSREIDRFLDGKIKAEMAAGRLAPAKRDDWMRKMEYEQSKHRK